MRAFDCAELAEINNLKVFVGLVADDKSTYKGDTPTNEVKAELQDAVSKKQGTLQVFLSGMLFVVLPMSKTARLTSKNCQS